MTPLLLLASPALADAPLEVRVTDPNVIALVLECADGSHEAVVKNGTARFSHRPEGCSVHMIRRGGRIDQPGKWTCDLDTCTQEDVHHAPVSDAPGRINVILSGELGGTHWLEVSCTDGYRQRVEITENTAVFEAVPGDDCNLSFKGGVPAQYRGITEGTWTCRLSGTTAVCTQR